MGKFTRRKKRTMGWRPPGHHEPRTKTRVVEETRERTQVFHPTKGVKSYRRTA